MFARWTPAELAERIAAGESLQLVDVRESVELSLCRLEGVTHIPLGDLASRASELDPDRPTVCICHHGIRSAQAAVVLATRFGFENVINLEGGMDRWSLEVDASVARY